MHWMREIIEKRNIDIGLPDVDTIGTDRKSPDIVIYESRRSQDALCVIEAKPPSFDVFDFEELKKPAWEKANKRRAKYFATTNFKNLIWYNTEKVNAQKPEAEQIVDKYSLSEIARLDDIEQTRYAESIQRQLESFLTRLFAVHSGREAEPKQSIDELLIFELHEKIRVLSDYYAVNIEQECRGSRSFRNKLRKWFREQNWNYTGQQHDFKKAARQTAYLLVNKILFYNVLQSKRQAELNRLEVAESLTKGALLQGTLQNYFGEVLKIDYETIYTTDFIDTIAFPDSPEVVKKIQELINTLFRYDLSKLGYDVIGRIFERLIPREERHNLGQYFTNADVVDVILKFCVHHEDDQVLDPACGAGTFLVRAYNHKKMMNQRLAHGILLNTLWGNDIAKFPAHLATINLAIRDLAVDKNYPNILQEDFFSFTASDEGFDLPEKYRRRVAYNLGKSTRVVVYPQWFDAVVGNPPYTRQEDIPEISTQDAKYKQQLIKNALLDSTGKKIAEIGKRAGIHAYFFVHGTKFLKDGGYFGFVVSNAWLDVQYGKGLQELFLKYYKIIAIIDSKVERWFEEADINTCIVILQKCSNEKERDENLVRFVYLKKKLSTLIPPAQEMWEKELVRLQALDEMKKTILSHNDFYENDDLRIYPKKQSELWVEGFDPEMDRYVGAKWGKYLRAPDIFFRILSKGRSELVQLRDLAQAQRGFTTGANHFFYLTESEMTRRKIEREFWTHRDESGSRIPNYVLKSPRECKGVAINPKQLKHRVLLIQKDKRDLKGKHVLKYIKDGERRGFHNRQTCASRLRWYELPEVSTRIAWIKGIWDRHFIPMADSKVFVDQQLYAVEPRENVRPEVLAAVLNSTYIALMQELIGRVNFGEGILWIAVYEPMQLLVPNLPTISKRVQRRLLDAFENLRKREIGSVFDELGARVQDGVCLENVLQDRRQLDNIVMGEILSLSDKEQLEVYRAVVDLVRTRIDRAKTFGKKNRIKEGIDVEAFVANVMAEIGYQTLGKFYREEILPCKPLILRELPRWSEDTRIENGLFGWRLYVGRKAVECRSEEEAHYLRIFVEAGLEEVKVPKQEAILKRILPRLESLKKSIDEIIDSYLESIVSVKLKKSLRHRLWIEIVKH
jgi:type I restriction enzyme M protein